LKASLSVGVVLVLALMACTSPTGPASSPPATSPSAAALNPAESKAADFRTRLDLLLGEHVIAIAKESNAAGRSDEFSSYLHLLTANGSELTELMRSALGDTAASTFDKIWIAQNDGFVNYTIGLVTHNRSKSDAAMSSLATKFVPQLSQFLATSAEMPLDPITQLTTQHVLETKALIDDQFAQSYSRAYADLRVVYAQASRIGDALAPKIAQRFPDMCPGDSSTKAVDVRVLMNDLLQENSYLVTMATSAAAGGRGAEQAAAARALGDNADDLGTLFRALFGQSNGTRFDQVWAARNSATLAYSTASSATARQNALSGLTGDFVTQFSALVHDATGLSSTVFGPAVAAQVEATIAVLDDQRSKSWAKLGGDDGAANSSMQSIADLITIAAVAKLELS
jgi:hypothetical protein